MMSDDEADRLVRTEDPILVEQGLRHYRQQAEEAPHDPERWFLYGGALDFTDHPVEAIVAYHRVFELGVHQIPADDQPKLYIQAGSTLRNLGRLDEARILLAEGVGHFPTCRALPVFLALVAIVMPWICCLTHCWRQTTTTRSNAIAVLSPGMPTPSASQIETAAHAS
jgi:hypothetical protein